MPSHKEDTMKQSRSMLRSGHHPAPRGLPRPTYLKNRRYDLSRLPFQSPRHSRIGVVLHIPRRPLVADTANTCVHDGTKKYVNHTAVHVPYITGKAPQLKTKRAFPRADTYSSIGSHLNHRTGSIGNKTQYISPRAFLPPSKLIPSSSVKATLMKR